jgi:tartrate-resistant acid phosphatase type 5
MNITIDRRTALGGLVAAASLPLIGAAPASPPRHGFIAMGDWGRGGSDHQRDVAAQMGLAMQGLDGGFVLAVGDNFYESGVASVDDPQWRTSFEDVYTDPALQRPWFVALGNHDYKGNPEAQIDYAAHSPRWRMPSRYYRVGPETHGMAGIDLFVIDTSPLVHKYREKVEDRIAANVAAQDPAAQLAWLDKALAASTAPIKLVAGHHTLRSGGSSHGDTPELVEQLLPILQRRGVLAYINGHDHDMQHIRRDGLDYICCGSGSQVRPVNAVEGTRFCLSRSGFALFNRTTAGLGFAFRDYTGAEVYQAELGAGARVAA